MLLAIKPTCSSYSDWNGPIMRAEHVGVGLAAVAGLTGDALDTRVVDRTGIKDRFVLLANSPNAGGRASTAR